MTPDPFDQRGHDVRFGWGRADLERLGPGADAVVIVDVLSFSTCVDVATARGARVHPWPWRRDGAAAFAAQRGARLAGRRGEPGAFTLSPASLRGLPAGAELVLPSPNGSELSFRARALAPTLAGSLRNRRAVAAAAARRGGAIVVVACGERWPDGSLRPAAEDLAGAGAVVDALPGARSPEAAAAAAAFAACRADPAAYLAACGSGRELIARGFADDVTLAAELDASDTAPLLDDEGYAAVD